MVDINKPRRADSTIPGSCSHRVSTHRRSQRLAIGESFLESPRHRLARRIHGACRLPSHIVGPGSIARNLSNLQLDARRSRRFAQRKAYLDRSLFAIGAIIGVGILATGILRDLSLEHIDAVSTENYPKSFVVAYGAYFSIMLALVFVPAQATLTNRGRRILTAWAHLGSIDEPEWETALSKRRTLEQALHLSGNPLERFQVGISLMAPILGAAVSYVAS